MAKQEVPAIPEGDLRAVSLQIELNPIEKEDLPVSVAQLLPLNEVKIRDSRENFHVTELSVLSILSHFGSQTVDLAVDYDHGMYYGENTEAAGWGEKLWAVVPSDWAERIDPFIEAFGDRVATLISDEEDQWGIYAFVRWTPAAAEKIRNREYRYISPVVFFDYSGNANYLWNAAVVNTPAIDGMDALAASIMQPKESVEGSSSSAEDNAPEEGEEFSADAAEEGAPKMPYLEKLAEALGLEPLADTEEEFNAEAFETEAVEKVKSLNEKNTEAEALAADYERVNAEVVSVREDLDIAKARIETFEAEAAERETKRQTDAIDAAVADGSIAESQRDWAVENFEAFEKLLPTLADNPQGPPQGQKIDEKPEEDLTLNPEEAKVAKIKAYAAENGISFTEAFKQLNP